MSAHVRLGGVTVNGRGHVSANAGANATVEARIEALEKNVGILSDRIALTQNEMDKKLREQTERLKQERASWQRDHEQLSKRLEASETGGLHVSAAGVLLLFFGVAMSTASPEIQRWMN
jgi:chromosome segregation ATPase